MLFEKSFCRFSSTRFYIGGPAGSRKKNKRIMWVEMTSNKSLFKSATCVCLTRPHFLLLNHYYKLQYKQKGITVMCDESNRWNGADFLEIVYIIRNKKRAPFGTQQKKCTIRNSIYKKINESKTSTESLVRYVQVVWVEMGALSNITRRKILTIWLFFGFSYI